LGGHIPRALGQKVTPSRASPPGFELSEEGFIGQLRTDALLAFLANLTQRDHAVDRHFDRISGLAAPSR